MFPNALGNIQPPLISQPALAARQAAVATASPLTRPGKQATMAGGGWQHLASSAKELASAGATKTRAVTASLGKAVVRDKTAAGLGLGWAEDALLFLQEHSRSAKGHGQCRVVVGGAAAYGLAYVWPCARPKPAAFSSVQAATSREVRHLVASDGESGSSPTPPGADGQHVQGPEAPAQQGQQEVQDAYGFIHEVTPEQAGILERCRARQEYVRAKWQAARGPNGLPSPDVLKKLCRKVGGHSDSHINFPTPRATAHAVAGCQGAPQASGRSQCTSVLQWVPLCSADPWSAAGRAA